MDETKQDKQSDTVNLKNMNERERKRRELHDLLTASDLNRKIITSEKVEDLAKKVFPGSKGVFWLLHSNHLAGNPARAINADSLGGQINNHATSKTAGEFRDQIGKVRTEAVKVGNFVNVDSGFLPQLESSFFQKIDAFLLNPSLKDLDENEKLRFLSQVEVIQTICHFPFDASGRTIEDFMVYLAQKMDLNLTISQTGLRGFLGGELVKESNMAREVIRVEANRALVQQYIRNMPNLDDATREKYLNRFKGVSETNTLNIATLLASFFKANGHFANETVQQITKEIFQSLRTDQVTLTENLISNMPDAQTPAKSLETPWSSFTRALDNFNNVLRTAQQQEYLSGTKNLLLVVMTPLLFARATLHDDPYFSELEYCYEQMGEAQTLLDKVEDRFSREVNGDDDESRIVHKSIELINHEIATTYRDFFAVLKQKSTTRKTTVQYLFDGLERKFPQYSSLSTRMKKNEYTK